MIKFIIASWDDLPCWGINLSKSQIYRLIRKGIFPKPFRLHPIATGGPPTSLTNTSPPASPSVMLPDFKETSNAEFREKVKKEYGYTPKV